MMSSHPDILIVGGGVIGLTCAWRLAQAGARTLLLERGEVGCGASGASLGALIPASPTRQGPSQRLQRASLWDYPEFAAELHDASGIDCGYRRCGRLELLASQERRAAAFREADAANRDWPASAAGPAMAVVSTEEAKALEPHIRAGEGGALLCRASARVDVARLIAGLRMACARSGAIVQVSRRVTGVLVEGRRVVGVRCGDELVAGGTVLVAAGAWTSSLSSLLTGSAPIDPVRGQALLLLSGAQLIERIIKRQSVYLVPHGDGMVLVGSTTEPDAGFSDKTTAQGIAMLSSAAMELVDALKDAAVVRAWAGVRPRPAARRPYLGPVPGVTGLYVAAGHYKTGVCLAPISGRVMADMILRRESDLDLSPFALTAADGAS